MSGSQQLLLAAIQQALPDPYFEYTTLLLPGNGTNGAQNNTFLDSSTNAFSITRNGNTTQGTFSPFSQTGWGNYFDGTGDYLTVPSNTAFAFNGAYTVEFWLYPLVQYGSSSIVGFFNETTTGGLTCYIDSSSRGITIGSRNVTNQITTGQYPTANFWNHVVVCRDASNNTSIYLNGNRIGTASLSTSYASSGGVIEIGTLATTSYPFNGYMSNLRVVKGTAVYDPTQASITVPTAPLTAITNTSLLTCQSNRFIDNSTNNFAITRNGDVSVQAFSPFNPTASWSAATNGGSGYFDGSGDYLSVADNAALEMGSSNFTIECWFYPLSLPSDALIADFGSQGAQGSLIPFYCSSSNVVYYISSGGGTWNIASGVSFGGTLRIGQWHHLALVRNGNTYTPYFNGVAGTTTTNSSAINDAAVNKFIGSATTGTAAINGYLSDFRVVKGTAVYTANFTPPTAPLTAITNTSLLCNFTNAGIYDATSKNDLETVGNAQISTTQSKFGGSSMYFDGTGDWLTIPNGQNFVFGSGDWTVELWVRPASSSRQGFATLGNNAGTNIPWEVGINASGKFRALVQTSGGQVIIDGTTTPSANTWYHVAVARYGGTVTLYVNGVAEATGSVSTNALVTETSPVYVGAYNYGFPLTGYIDDLRITKGIARYTSNFTPPTTAFLTL